MKIDIMTSAGHPIRSVLDQWAGQRKDTAITTDKSTLRGGDFLFLISCTEMIPAATRALYTHTLVVHASDLPRGKGWSPHIWTLLEGGDKITVSLFEAVDKVDAGRIWKKEIIPLQGHELYDEINAKLFTATLTLLDFAIANAAIVKPVEQDPLQESFYKKRTPEDSRIDPDKTIAEQFNLLRVCDPNRFPAFFEFAGCKYKVIIEKMN
jgi:methionyl-tRNA formyltransferase